MKIDSPAPGHMPQLRQLWQDAFGDTDLFLDSFYRTAYSPSRCRCIFSGETVAAVLYWMDCTLEGRKLAYIYAVVTRPQYRGQGLCRMLMENTHTLLAQRDYAGVLLVPQQESLRNMYAGMGYQNAGGLAEFRCSAAEAPFPLRALGAEEFSRLRRRMLPSGAVLQEGHSLDFLAQQLQFYAGERCLLAAYCENGILHVPELLGDASAVASIVGSLGCREGRFRMPGGDKPFAMFLSLTENAPIPQYFGFAFD